MGEVRPDRGPLLGLILTHIKNSLVRCVNQQHGAAPFDIHGDEQMVTQSNIHFFTNWAKERLDEMDATVTSLEGKAAEVQADVRDKAKKVLADLRKQRDDFRDTMKKQSEANEAAWIQAKAKLEADWACSRPRSRNMSKASASKSSTSRRRSSFKPMPN